MERYQGHLTLPKVGVQGQAQLLRSRVLVVGVGGVGCPVLQYLAASGVGTLGLLDDDRVDTTNLQRQVLFGTADVGRPKVEVARERLEALNPDVLVKEHQLRLSASNALEIVQGWDLVVDGSDNFATRYVINDACVLAGVPLVTGSIYQYEAQVTVFRPPATPCYRCIFPVPPPDQQPCRDVGVLAPLAGLVGNLLAAEVLKLLVSGRTSLMGRLLLVDLLQTDFRTVQLKNAPDCPLCGRSPAIEHPTSVPVGGTGAQ